MGQSLCQCYLHVIFSTKDRQASFVDREERERVWTKMAFICGDLKSPVLAIDGVEDHAHIVTRLAKTVKISDLVKEIKRRSSIWIKDSHLAPPTFGWQKGYGAFSVGASELERAVQYVRNQENHHHSETFQEEFRRWCADYDLDIDERYVWD